MLFNSYEFIFVFLPITLSTFFILAKYKYTKLSTVTLIIASLIFYAQWNIKYLPLLLGSTLFNYWIGTLIEQKRKKIFLILGIGVNLALLGYFKYVGFFISSCNEILQTAFFVPQIILPLGISFFTFTQTAYLLDAYRGETKQYSLLTYGLFVTVFPHLIAGPILYHKDMIPQFSKLRNFVFSNKNFAMGITLFSIGLFKKVVIADTLAPWVKIAFDYPEILTPIEAWMGAISYTLQLYFDFSGYSDMAVGLGLMLNLKLPINFNSPYQATSIIEFWKRWHISLSAFLKNYLYIPLGGNRKGSWMKMRNLMITMLLGGLWHGAGWTFVYWGGIHGTYLVVNHQWRKTGIALPKIINWLITFVCIVVAWVFFRADNIHDALAMIQAMVNVQNIVLPGGADGFLAKHFEILNHLGIKFSHFTNAHSKVEYLVLCGCMMLIWMRNSQELLQRFKPNLFWWTAIVTLNLISFYFLGNISEFLYFQF